MAKESFLILVFACFFTCIVGGVGFSLFMSLYKELIGLRKNVKLSWKKIDSILRKRQEDISKLVQVASKAVGEQQVIIKKIQTLKARFKIAKRLGARIKISNEISLALHSLFALVEAYPELKRNEDYVKIEKQFADYQLQLLKWSGTFNNHVEIYNLKVSQIPESLLAKVLGYSELDRVVVHELQKSSLSKDINLAA